MNKVGEIALILNSKFAIAKTTTPLILGSEVLAYTEIKVADADKDNSGIETVSIPKGKLKVILRQSENQYLLSIIDRNSMEANAENESLARNLSSFKQIQASNQAQQNSEAPYSAQLDRSFSLNLEFNPLAIPGDSIAYTNHQSQSLNNR